LLDEGTTFIFGSWICIVNGLGGFNSHLANSREPETSSSTQSSDLVEFIDNLDELLLPDLVLQVEKMSVFDATSTPDAPDLVGSDSKKSKGTTQSKSLSDLEKELDLLLKLKDVGATACRGPIFNIYLDSNEEYSCSVLHLQASPEKDSEMREPLPVGRPLLLKTSSNLIATLNPFRATIRV
jgi:hypothetical protein